MMTPGALALATLSTGAMAMGASTPTLAAGGPTGALLHAFVYLATAVLAVPIAQRLGLGSVLGYLGAGALIGPAGLGLVGDTESVMHFAEFGVVMMLFLIGLELRPRALWSMRVDVLGLGGLQLAVTGAALAGLLLALGVDVRAAIALGATLALSSTAIVMQTLSERGLTESPAGRRAFAVLLFQDIAVIPILALLPLLAPAGAGGPEDPSATPRRIDHLPGLAQAGIILVVIALIVLGGKLLARPLFRAVAGTRIRELFSAAALLIVVGIALLMGLVGLSAALGTFLAGVVLADSEYRHELESDLAPFKGLLLGLFFITVGAQLDLGLVASRPLVVLGLLAGLIAVKALVLAGLARVFGLARGPRSTFALILAQAGEFGFVLLATCTSLGILDSATGQLATAAVALSMALTPLLLLLDDRVLQPRASSVSNACELEAREGVPRPEGRSAPVVVAGFGRYGQLVARLLRANGYDCTVLDLDPARVEVLRKHGMPVFFGDATRPELLESAGCGHAGLFVLTIEDPTHALLVAETVHKHFPALPVVARAYDVRHAHSLRGAGAADTVCASQGGGLELGRAVLRAVGFDPYRAERAVRRFQRHEEETQAMLFEALGDADRSLRIAQMRTADLDRLLEADEEAAAAATAEADAAWSTDALRESVRAGEEAI